MWEAVVCKILVPENSTIWYGQSEWTPVELEIYPREYFDWWVAIELVRSAYHSLTFLGNFSVTSCSWDPFISSAEKRLANSDVYYTPFIRSRRFKICFRGLRKCQKFYLSVVHRIAFIQFKIKTLNIMVPWLCSYPCLPLGNWL